MDRWIGIRRQSSFLWVMTLLCWSQIIQQEVVAVLSHGNNNSPISQMRIDLEEEELHNTTETMDATATTPDSKKKGFGTVPMIVVAIGAAVLFFSLLLLFLWRRAVLRERRLYDDDSEYSSSSYSSHDDDDPDGPSFDSDVSWDDDTVTQGDETGTNKSNPLDKHSVEMGTA